MRTIVVTGSIGKTSAKEMVYSVLSASCKTARNAGSANSTREACRILFNLDESYSYDIMELGLRAPNMPFRFASNILKPDVGLITNIGYSHIENFKDKAQILEHKLSITSGMSSNGILVLNADDDLMYNSSYDFRTIFYGIKNQEADFLAKDIELDNEGSTFRVISKDGTVDFQVVLNVPGEHNILNALGAVAIAKHFDISDETIIKGLANFKTSGFRQNVVRGFKNNLIIADCYNATPESMISGFEMLKNTKTAGRKFAVLGHMMRLGKHSEELHRKTGKDVASYNFDEVITFGKDAHYIYEEVKKSGGKAVEFFTKEDVIRYLKSNVDVDDVILFKGVEKFNNFQDIYYNFADNDYALCEQEYSGLYADDTMFHSDAKSIYFGRKNQCFVSKNCDKKVLIRDISLIFLVVMVIENAELGDRVTISKSAALRFVNNTGIRFNPTNIFTVEDLLYAVLFKSSFEAAYSLLEYVFESFEKFSVLLDAKFRELGIHNTAIASFSPKLNQHTYTTAYDMYLFTCYALQNDKFLNLVRDKVHVLNNLKSGKQTPIQVNNKLLHHEKNICYLDYYSEAALGVKAENIYTDANLIKDKSLVSCVETSRGNIIGVILGSDDFYYCNSSYIDMARLLELSFKYNLD